MWFLVTLLGIDYEYNTVKDFWLGQFQTKDKDVDEGQFYIKLNTLEDLVEVSNLVGVNIEVGTFCDEPMIVIPR